MSISAPLLNAYLPADVELHTGARLQYVEQGAADGVPVVLLHGWSDTWRSFEPVLPFLPAGLRAIAVTQRGHGEASHPARLTLDAYADDVAALIDELRLDAAVLVGHSLGSIVARRVATKYPERTAGLVLAGTRGTFGDGVLDDVFAEVEHLDDPVDPGFVREFQESTCVQPVPAGYIDLVVRESLKMPARAWRGARDGVLRPDTSSELRDVLAPTLVIAGGADDLAAPEAGASVATAIADARLRIYEDGGHAFHWEEPARFAADVTRFATSVAR